MSRRLRIVLGVGGALALLVVVLNWTYGRLPAEPKPTGSFATVDGVRIRYLEHTGAGTPILLIHGLPGTADDFDAVTPLLAGHRTIAIDRPGFGYSSGGYVPFERQLTIVHDLLAKLGIPRAVIVGHSYGGMIAMGMAERYPQQVAGLVLVDAAGGSMKMKTLSLVQARSVQLMNLPVIRPLAHITFSQLALTVTAKQGDEIAFSPQPVNPAHEHRLLAINLTPGNLRAFSDETVHADNAISDVDRAMRSITAPTIVLQGNRDQLVAPVHGREIAAAIPHAQLIMLYGGHMQTYVHPFAVATAVMSVLHRGGRT